MSYPSSTNDTSRAEDKNDDIIADNWSDWSDDDDGDEFNRELWESFDNVFPHLQTYIQQQQTRDNIARANERFNIFYNDVGMRETKVYFSDIVYILE